MNDLTRQEFEAQIIAKAWKDDAFRERLLADPKAVFAEELVQVQPGVNMPAELNIQVVEESPSTLYLVLPARQERAAGGELSEQELDAVAGGQGYAEVCLIGDRNTKLKAVVTGDPFASTAGYVCGNSCL